MKQSEDLDKLKEYSRKIRELTLETGFKAGNKRKPHLGPALSIADVLSVLYFKHLNVNPLDPKMGNRDRVILSKGHACISLYSTLALKGYFSPTLLESFRKPKSALQGHPDMNKTLGIDMTTGSLGNGIGAAIGIAYSQKHKKQDSYTFVILGDGELNEGIVWEAAQSAYKYKLDNLIAIVDINNLQSGGSCKDVMPSVDIGAKWAAFGWNIIKIDGHDVELIDSAITIAKKNKNIPTAILLSTIKGRGISFMENNNSWHQRAPSEAEYKQAKKELLIG